MCSARSGCDNGGEIEQAGRTVWHEFGRLSHLRGAIDAAMIDVAASITVSPCRRPEEADESGSGPPALGDVAYAFQEHAMQAGQLLDSRCNEVLSGEDVPPGTSWTRPRRPSSTARTGSPTSTRDWRADARPLSGAGTRGGVPAPKRPLTCGNGAGSGTRTRDGRFTSASTPRMTRDVPCCPVPLSWGDDAASRRLVASGAVLL